MTELEAAKKWCPFVRNDYKANGGNRGQHGCVQIAPCIGSHCMAWRWRTTTKDNPKHGRCGLAGEEVQG